MHARRGRDGAGWGAPRVVRRVHLVTWRPSFRCSSLGGRAPCLRLWVRTWVSPSCATRVKLTASSPWRSCCDREWRLAARQAMILLKNLYKAGAGAALGVRVSGFGQRVLVRAFVRRRVLLHVLEPPDGRTQARERLPLISQRGAAHRWVCVWFAALRAVRVQSCSSKPLQLSASAQ